jgi:hypothetical protein
LCLLVLVSSTLTYLEQLNPPYNRSCLESYTSRAWIRIQNAKSEEETHVEQPPQTMLLVMQLVRFRHKRCAQTSASAPTFTHTPQDAERKKNSPILLNNPPPPPPPPPTPASLSSGRPLSASLDRLSSKLPVVGLSYDADFWFSDRW